MRIAIYDDNIADRRHAERLLKRESDRLHSLGGEGHVIDCLGSGDKLRQAADTYDMIFIGDTATEDGGALAVAGGLRAIGILAPIVICSDTGDSAAPSEDPEADGFYRLKKPYTPETLIPMSEICGRHLAPKKGKIELRTEGETLKVSGSDILYAAESERGYLTVALLGDRLARIQSDAPSLFEQIKALGEDKGIFPVSQRAFVNSTYIKKSGFLSVEMTDGKKLSVSPVFAKNLKDQ